MLKIRQWVCVLMVLMSFSIFAVGGVNAVTLDEIKNYRPQYVTYNYDNGSSINFNFSINNTFTLDAGNPASVFNIGNSTNILLDFFIPKGDTGATGSTGSSGAGISINQSAYLMVNGTNKMENNISMNGFRIVNVSLPSISSDVATKAYVDLNNQSAYLRLNGTNAMENNLNVSNFRIIQVANVTTNGDALPYTQWVNWSGSIATWSNGTPTGANALNAFRYTIIGKTLYFYSYVRYSDSNGAKLASITVPISPAYYPIFIGRENYGNAGSTIGINSAYINQGQTTLNYDSSTSFVGTDNSLIAYLIEGFYEVA